MNGAVGCAHYREYADTLVQAVIRFEGDYRLVFFACAFEAIDHSSRYVQRWTLLNRILTWFGERVPATTEPPQESTCRDAGPVSFEILPSPFARAATVDFLPTLTGAVELRLFSADGRLVRSDHYATVAGRREGFTLDAGNLPAGVYLAQLVTPAGTSSRTTAILR